MWKKIPLFIPENEQEVWIRIKYYYSAPFLATYYTADQQFISTVNSIIYPVWTVARWKPQ